MKCQTCRTEEASIYITERRGERIVKMHICQQCVDTIGKFSALRNATKEQKKTVIQAIKIQKLLRRIFKTLGAPPAFH